MLILVADRRLCLSVEVKEEQFDKKSNSNTSGEESMGLATYCNSKSTVLSYASIFESLWRQDELYQQLDKSRDELDEMKRYLDQVLNEVKRIK